MLWSVGYHMENNPDWAFLMKYNILNTSLRFVLNEINIISFNLKMQGALAHYSSLNLVNFWFSPMISLKFFQKKRLNPETKFLIATLLHQMETL